MYVWAMIKFITREFLQPKQSGVRARRPMAYWNVSLACYRMMSVWVLDPCVVQKWKCGRLALANRESVSGDDLYVTRTHSSWRYYGAVWWRHLKLKIIKQSLKTILS